MAVLYRKYRPQTFSEVLGQKHIVQTLRNQVISGNPAHAFLFTGSRGVGKTSVARIFAKAVNCTSGDQKTGDACGVCDICKQIEQGNFLDLIEVDAASNTGVDNVRDLIEHIKFSPSVGKYKVFIVDEVHMLSKGAFNALLKTLEEPPGHAIFILATTEINKVPVTIVSRTQRFDFKRFSAEELKAQISKVLLVEKQSLDPKIIELVAQNAEGGARDALSLLDKVLTLGDSASLEDCQSLLGITDIAVSEKLFDLIVEGKASELPDFFQELMEKGMDLNALNRDFLEYLRKALVLKISNQISRTALNDDALSRLKNFISKVSAAELIFFLKLFLKSFKDLSGAPAAEIPLLIASLEAAFKRSGVSSSVPTGTTADLRSEDRNNQINENNQNSRLNNSSLDNHQASSLSSSSPGVGRMSRRLGDGTGEVEMAAPAPSLSATLEGKSEVTDRQDSNQPSQLQEVSSIPVEPIPEAPAIDLDEIKQHWPEVISKIKAVNSPLANTIRGSVLQSSSGNILEMGVKFLFHKQSLDNPKNQAMISEILMSVYNKPLKLRAQVIKTSETVTSDSGLGLDNALKVFGGELIN